jgi:ankyrin repeat protein
LYWEIFVSKDEIDNFELRHMILSNDSIGKIKKFVNSEKGKTDIKTPVSNYFADHFVDPLVHVASIRPDVLSFLFEFCSNEENNCVDVSIDKNNGFKKTPLMTAAQHGVLDSVKYLVKNGANINAQTVKYIDYYSDEGPKPDRTALMYAILEGHYDIALYLIENGADISIKDARGYTAYDYLNGIRLSAKIVPASPSGIIEVNCDKDCEDGIFTKPSFTERQERVLKRLLNPKIEE